MTRKEVRDFARENDGQCVVCAFGPQTFVVKDVGDARCIGSGNKWTWYFSDEDELFDWDEYNIKNTDLSMRDAYANDLFEGDRIALIEQFNTHHHCIRTATISKIKKDARGFYAILIVDFFDPLGGYTKKIYNTDSCTVKI